MDFDLNIMQRKITTDSKYFGIPTLKCPMDAWVYQEIVNELKPDTIVEIGNFCGGSALMLAHWLDQLGKGQVVAVDVNHANIDNRAWNHNRIRWVTGDAGQVVGQVKERIKGAGVVLVIEDSSHQYAQTLEVLRNYGPLVTKGSYLIVEDTICRHGLEVGPVHGPYEAVEKFLDGNIDFVVDRSREGYGVTWNPDGFLRRVQ